ncbi:MAG: hypothetical protein K2V38_20495, partial [Gemmataceae bacterium]|nr:hypothetical protein [Gemmataceae bacterium]
PGPFKRTHTLDVRGATAVAWSPDRKTLAVAVARDEYVGWWADPKVILKPAVALFDLATVKEVKRVGGFADNLLVTALAFRPDGKELLCGAGFPPGRTAPGSSLTPEPAKDAKGLRVIPLAEPAKPAAPAWKEQFSTETVGWMPGSVGYALDGQTLFAGGSGGAVRAYDVKTRKELWKYEGDGRFAAVAVSGGVRLATRTTSAVAVTVKGGVRLLDPKTGKVLDTFDTKGAEPVAVAAFPERGVTNFDGGGFAGTECKVVFGSLSEYTAKSWFRTPDGKSGPPGTNNLAILPPGRKPADEYAVPLAVSGGGRAVVTGPFDRDARKNVLWLWGAGGGAEDFILDGHKAAVVCAAWSHDATMCVTGDADGVVILWDADKAKEKSRLNLGGRVVALAVSGDQKHVAAAVARLDEWKAGPVYDEEVFVWPLAGAPKKPEPVS